MKKLLRNWLMLLASVMFAVPFVGCSSDEPDKEQTDDENGDNGDGNPTEDTEDKEPTYGDLAGNLITIGSYRDVTYTSCVLLGTVDFPKITGDHTYGVVYMEAVQVENFDYDAKLEYGGHSNKTDKVQYNCIHVQVNSSTSDGKFEKQLVNLKPATTYYYRAYVRIGSNLNYSKVESVTTKNPASEITMATLDPSDLFAVKGTMNGAVRVGNLQDVNEDQEYGFIYTTFPQLNAPDKLTYEYYEQWTYNHFDTEDQIERPQEVTTSSNMNGRISYTLSHLRPGTTYYYRSFFSWNGKYFYGPEVKTLNTLGLNVITVGTDKASEVTTESAELGATVPFSQIGLERVSGGFLISKVYSNASEFDRNTAVSWNDRDSNPKAEVFYLSTTVDSKDFKRTIEGLAPETTYYYCAYISLGVYDDEEMYVYGKVQSFTTPAEPTLTSSYSVSSSGQYPWTERGTGNWVSGNSNVPGSESVLDITVTHNPGDELKFYLRVSSEAGCDGAYVYTKASDKGELYSGNVTELITVGPFTKSGTTVVHVEYKKDGTLDSGSDNARAYGFQVVKSETRSKNKKRK